MQKQLSDINRRNNSPRLIRSPRPLRSLFACCLLLFLLALSCVSHPAAAAAQSPRSYDAAQLRLLLERLNVAGSVLHIAAHPDDENTALLAYLAGERRLRTAYLSLTRGDGGQNLIGNERGAALGVIRTQELLAARRIDGAEQFFTRAVDFGFSKSPEETLRIWNRDEVLADVVWVIRRFRPDVVITRFPTTGEGGHGHHTASAILAVEAFRIAGDPTKFPEQLRYVEPWQPRRLVWNAFRPNRGGAPSPPAPDPSLLSLDLGAYNALLGKSYTEIAAESRTMHKSQGFGSQARRGTSPNLFAHIAGERATKDLFDGVDTTWARFSGKAGVREKLAEALRTFDSARPHLSLPLLIAARRELANSLPANDSLLNAKHQELTEAIGACAGLWVEAVASERAGVPGESAEVTATIVKRLPAAVRVLGVEGFLVSNDARTQPTTASSDLAENTPLVNKVKIELPANLTPSQPYWLRDTAPDAALARVDDQRLRGLPENPPALAVRFRLAINDAPFELIAPVFYRDVDRVRGERYLPFEILPPLAINFDDNVFVFPDTAAKDVRLTLRANAANLSGNVSLTIPAGWTATPNSMPVSFAAKDAERTITFRVAPSPSATSGTLAAHFNPANAAASKSDGSSTPPLARGTFRIAYDHIPEQTLFPSARIPLVRVDIRRSKKRIAYVMGAGDDVPQSLRQIGYDVQMLADADLGTLDLSAFDAIITGIRAYNTRAALRTNQTRLLDYVQQGGTLIVQYNTPGDDLPANLAPYPLKISRERVTLEDAPVTISDDKLLTQPNRITNDDFSGWVQERGLYFAGEWDKNFRAPLATADPDETPKRGGTLITNHGRGTYIYTGYAWFRQLPAGVPGAYRLFANMIEQ